MENGLIDLRKKAKLSRFKLAVKLNVSPSSVDNWEKGVAKPSADAIYNLAKVYNTTTDNIFLALNTTKVVNYDKK